MTILGQMLEDMGIEKGINRVNQLNLHLLNANRLDDMIKSTKDTEY